MVGPRDFRSILLREAIEPRLVPESAQEAPKAPAATKKPLRRATLAAALKAAANAGRAVVSAEVYADHVRLEFGQPAKTGPGETIDTPDELRRLI